MLTRRGTYQSRRARSQLWVARALDPSVAARWHAPSVPRPLRALLRRIGSPREARGDGDGPAEATAPTRLSSAVAIEARLRREGGDLGAALRCGHAQIAGLLAEIDDDIRWARLRELARRIGDPWNADDWPLGFDALLLVVPLCKRVDYECGQCPVGRRQEGRSCAHPQTRIGSLGALIRGGDREEVRNRLDELAAELRALEP